MLLVNGYILLYGSPGCFAGMAPKSSQGNKRKKANTSTPQPPRSYDHQRFKSAHHQDRYRDLLPTKTWNERVFNISPQGPYQDIGNLFLYQKWEKLLHPPTEINHELVREFYANAIPENPLTDPFDHSTFVRGRTIRFDREAINEYLGNPYPLADEDELDEFHDRRNKGNFDHDEIKRTILLEGANYDISDAGREYRARYSVMTLPAKITLKLILHNIQPNSHLSDTTLDVTPLIYYILTCKKVDIARTIAEEMKRVALQGLSEPRTRLFFPGLIMGLLKESRLHMPSSVHEEIKNPIDDIFIARHIEGKKKRDTGSHASTSQAIPPPQPQPEPHAEPQQFPPQAFDFPAYAQWQYQCHTHTWDLMEAGNRANTYLQQSLYQMQQQAGYPPEVMNQFLTPVAYQAHVAWPGVRPNAFGGDGAARGIDERAEGEEGQGDGSNENFDQDDPSRVFSANTTRSDDGSDGGSEDIDYMLD
jgi:hypothetical protein